MNGPEIFNFTLRVIPALVLQLLERTRVTRDEVDLWVFHQANQFMLDYLKKKLGILEDRFVISFASCGNTVSSSIPIALKHAETQGPLKAGHRVALVGFGVGYSWAGTVVKWR
jgi:3-oxoacyl-[acyl-carrier-protein] synthase-3